MLIEIWSNLISLLQTLLPMLSPARIKEVNKVIHWAQSQPNTHHGINQEEIDWVVNFLDNMLSEIPKEWAEKIHHAQYFLRALNNGVNAAWLEHQGTCGWWGYYWYDNTCHAEPKPKVFDCRSIRTKAGCINNNCYWWDGLCHAEGKPQIPFCSAHSTQNACLSAGCYWWDGSCHSKPKPLPAPCEDHKYEYNCWAAGCYWWDGSCHSEVKPPPPPDIRCQEWKTEVQCLTGGCYWWDGSCHDTPEVIPPGVSNPVREFAKQVTQYCATIPLTKPLELINCGILSSLLNITADVFDFFGKKR